MRHHRRNVYFFRSRHSVIFVAFDKNHDGKIGSKRFISEYLIPHVVKKYGCQVQAVLSLELDRNINQLVPPSNNNYQETRGPRTALINRGAREERSLLEMFQRNLLAMGAKGLPFSFPNLNSDPGHVKNLGEFRTYYSVHPTDLRGKTDSRVL